MSYIITCSSVPWPVLHSIHQPLIYRDGRVTDLPLSFASSLLHYKEHLHNLAMSKRKKGKTPAANCRNFPN